MEAADRLRRWRLILGAEAKKRMENMDKGVSLTDEDLMMDTALDAIYNRNMKCNADDHAGVFQAGEEAVTQAHISADGLVMSEHFLIKIL